MINVNPMIWFKSCNTNLLIIIIIINKHINGSHHPNQKFIVQKSFLLYISFKVFIFIIIIVTLFIIFFYVIIIIVVIVIKITPDFCHKYRNDMQFPSFWVKIFFFNFLKNVILQFGPFLLSMPHITYIWRKWHFQKSNLFQLRDKYI